MDSLDSMLKTRRPQEPPQVLALKQYALDTYGEDILVKVSTTYYLVVVPGAALAQRFRMDSLQISEVCELDKKLVIHIGH